MVADLSPSLRMKKSTQQIETMGHADLDFTLPMVR
jgi:hypothetical protein